MKKGVNLWTLNWSARPGEPSFNEICKLAKQLGYQGLEFVFDEEFLDPRKWSDEQIAKFKEEARQAGVEIPSVATGLFWKYNLGSPDKKIRGDAISWVKQGLRLANGLGAKVLLVVPAVTEPSVPYEKTYELSMRSIKSLVEVAEDLNVIIGIENVWNKFLYSPIEFSEFIRGMRSKWIKAYLDVANIAAIGHPTHWIRVLGKRIAMVHAKDFDSSVGNITGFRHIGKGDVNWREAIAELKKVGYDWYLMVECPPSFYPGLTAPTFEDGRRAAAENSSALDALL